MPSPIGHALAGVAVAWTADAVRVGRRTAVGRPIGVAAEESHRLTPQFVALCAALAMLPDADLLLRGAHRTMTHSLTAAILVFIVAVAVTGEVTQGRGGRWRTATICALAYASHLLLDWLAADRFPPRGIQLLWPFSDRWFISDWDIFRQTARQHLLTLPIVRQNAFAVAQEIAILMPVLAAIWLARKSRSSS